MLRPSLVVIAISACAPAVLSAQPVAQRSGTTAEFRSLHAASANVVWAGGRAGTFAVTTDGGATWRSAVIAGADSLFITGIWAGDARTAHAVATSFDGGHARIYRTGNGGASWALQYEVREPDVFFDALRCFSETHCIAYGDPYDHCCIDGPMQRQLPIVRTTDGRTWQRLPYRSVPAALDGEAGFAASGTTLTTFGSRHAWLGTGGGARARVFRTSDGGATWQAAETPMPGNATTGIFGLAFRDSLNGVAVGGDYEKRQEAQQNVLRTSDGGRSWRVAGAALPAGVRYGAAYSPQELPGGVRALLATGPSGTGVSFDDGATWLALDTLHYNTLAFAPNGDAYLGGPNGRLARIPAAQFGTAAASLRDRAPAQYPSRFSAELAQRPAVRDALAWLEQNFARQVEEWIRITEIPGTSRHEQQRAAYVKAQLEAEGYSVSVDSIGNVIAVRPGSGGGETVVFAAHMDTVHPLDTDVTVRHDSATVGGRRARVLRAPGIFDNSASVANMLAVARALNRANLRTRGDIIFIATVQEELGLIGMDYWLERNPGTAQVLVALDGGLPNVNYGALGIYWTRYFFRGAGSHTNTSAGRPHPARALADAIRSIYEIPIPEYMGGAVYNVGMLDGGKIFNAIPEEVSFTMDLRSVNPLLLNDLDAQIDSAVARAAAAHGVQWAKQSEVRNRAGGTEQMLADRLRHPLIQTALDVHAHVGITSRAIATGSTDANQGVVRGIPSISIGRSLGGDQHTLSEWAEVDSALPATKIVLLLALAMAGLTP